MVHLTTSVKVIKLPFSQRYESGFIFNEYFCSINVFFNYLFARKRNWLDITLVEYNWFPEKIVLTGLLESKQPKIMNIMDFGVSSLQYC